MNQTQREGREFALKALAAIRPFVTDSDTRHRDREASLEALDQQEKTVREGKFRVVFLGAFNVGKSTLVNALLGGEYLPTVLEECTSKITHIHPGTSLSIHLQLRAPATDEELAQLGEAIRPTDPALERSPDGGIMVLLPRDREGVMATALFPLVTVLADEDFPQLASLRDKIEEVVLHVPNPLLGDEIVLTDSPGVHSISETRQKITYDLIPRCQLVISLIDSENAGNVHDLRFIEHVIKLRKRRVFFVINKVDQLNEDEIDPRCRRGPAKSLADSLVEVTRNPDIFFVSAYYALKSQLVSRGSLTLEVLDEDNKIKIPQRVWREQGTREGIAEYLAGQSRFEHFKGRLTDYLFNENKEMAVAEGACAFIANLSERLCAPLDTELAMARDPAKLEELAANQEKLQAEIVKIRKCSNSIFNGFNIKVKGGSWDGVAYRGLASIIHEMVTEEEAEARVIQPIRRWLDDDDNLRQAKADKFKPVQVETEFKLDAFVGWVISAIDAEMARLEAETEQQVAELLRRIKGLRLYIEGKRPGTEEYDVGIAGHYAGWSLGVGLGGALTGAGIGAAATSWSGPGAIIGAGVGALVGAVAGLVIGRLRSDLAWREKLVEAVRSNVMDLLIRGVKPKKGSLIPSVRENLAQQAMERPKRFEQHLRDVVETAITEITDQMASLLERRQEIEAQRAAIIERLEPKQAELRRLGQQARQRLTRSGRGPAVA